MLKQKIVAIAILSVVIIVALLGRTFYLSGRVDASQIMGVVWTCDATFDGRSRQIQLLFGDRKIQYLRAETDQTYFVGFYTVNGSKFRATFDSDYWPSRNYSARLPREMFWAGTFKKATPDALEIDTVEALTGIPNMLHVVATCHK